MGKPIQKILWDDKYSVGVEEIDNQHKQLLDTINNLIEIIGENSMEERQKEIIESILKYKEKHFSTEENYFKLFNYEGTEDHIQEHQMFRKKIDEIQKENSGSMIELSFKLVDFLEDWLIDHLMNTDQKYKECFKAHGLK